MMNKYTSELERNTLETQIKLKIDLSETAKIGFHAASGIGFFDHMLNTMAHHMGGEISGSIKGDTFVDCHHTIEDVGIVLGEAIKQAVGDKKGIKRYGSFMLPMDETLMLCAIDLSGRPYFVMDCDFTVDRVGEFDTEMVREFFYAVSYGSMMNLHLKKLHGENNHHMIEAAFKAFAKALDEACSYDPRITDVLSTKGAL